MSVFKKSSSAPSAFPKVSNVNISFRLSDFNINVFFSKCLPFQSHNNIHVFRDPEIKKRVYTVFHSGHINITGIKIFSEIESSIDRFNLLFKQTVKKEDVQVNNSTASGNIFADKRKILNFQSVKKYIEKNKGGLNDITFNFRPHYFPGAILRRKNKSTIILFSNGKYNIIGSKDRLAVREAHRTLCAITRNII